MHHFLRNKLNLRSTFLASSSVDAEGVTVLIDIQGAKGGRDMLTHLSAKVMSSIVGIRAVTQIFITSVNLVLHGNTGAAILARESSSTLAPAIRVCLVLAAKTVRAFGAFTMLVILFTVEFFLTKLECSLVKVEEAPQTLSAVLAAKIALLPTERSSKLAVRSMETIFAVARRNFVRIGFTVMQKGAAMR